jgi:hypothetical protein
MKAWYRHHDRIEGQTMRIGKGSANGPFKGTQRIRAAQLA